MRSKQVDVQRNRKRKSVQWSRQRRSYRWIFPLSPWKDRRLLCLTHCRINFFGFLKRCYFCKRKQFKHFFAWSVQLGNFRQSFSMKEKKIPIPLLHFSVRKTSRDVLAPVKVTFKELIRWKLFETHGHLSLFNFWLINNEWRIHFHNFSDGSGLPESENVFQ